MQATIYENRGFKIVLSTTPYMDLLDLYVKGPKDVCTEATMYLRERTTLEAKNKNTPVSFLEKVGLKEVERFPGVLEAFRSLKEEVDLLVKVEKDKARRFNITHNLLKSEVQAQKRGSN